MRFFVLRFRIIHDWTIENPFWFIWNPKASFGTWIFNLNLIFFYPVWKFVSNMDPEAWGVVQCGCIQVYHLVRLNTCTLQTLRGPCLNYANYFKPSPEVPPVDPKFLPRPKNISGFEMICIIHKAQIAVGTFHTALKEQVPHNRIVLCQWDFLFWNSE